MFLRLFLIIISTCCYNLLHAGTGYFANNFPKDSLIVENAISIPIVLNFEAKRYKNKVELSWKCAIQCEEKSYLVQRSTDANKYRSVAHVNSTYLSENQNHVVTDENPASGTVYYRLLLKLPDGNYTVLEKVKLKTAFIRNQTIISGEVEDYLKIRDTNFELGDVVKITITDANGSYVMGQNVIITSDVIELNLIGLTSGNYFLTAKTGLYELKARFKKL